MIIALSASVKTITGMPDIAFQASPGIPLDDTYRNCLWEGFPSNVVIVHAPVRFEGNDWELFVQYLRKNPQHDYVFHPNHSILKRFDEEKFEDMPNVCIENFPWVSKKPLRTPIDTLLYAKSRNLSVCFDFAHVDPENEPEFRSFTFLRSYLPHVRIVHFSGNRHNKLTEEEWAIWERLAKEAPQSFSNIKAFALEHIKAEDKISDGQRLGRLLKTMR